MLAARKLLNVKDENSESWVALIWTCDNSNKIITKIDQMQSSVQRAVVRQAAPAFRLAAWHENKIQEISLDQYKGKLHRFKLL